MKWASLLTFLVCTLGCSGGNSVTMGTTQVTSIAPSHTFPYPVGDGQAGGPPAFGKGNVPGMPGKK